MCVCIDCDGILFQELVLAERERQWNGMKTEMSSELDRVRGDLNESQTQYQLLKDSNEKVSE